MSIIHHSISISTKRSTGNLIDFEILEKRRNDLWKHFAVMFDKKTEQNFNISQNECISANACLKPQLG